MLSETLVAWMIFTVLAVGTVFAGASFYQKHQLQARAEEVKQIIRFARSQALNQQKTLLLAPLCQQNWSQGMRLCIDNPEHQCQTDQVALHEWHWFAQNIHVKWQGFQSKHFLRFAHDLSQSAANGHFKIENNAHQAVVLQVNRLGRVKLDAE